MIRGPIQRQTDPNLKWFVLPTYALGFGGFTVFSFLTGRVVPSDRVLRRFAAGMSAASFAPRQEEEPQIEALRRLQHQCLTNTQTQTQSQTHTHTQTTTNSNTNMPVHTNASSKATTNTTTNTHIHKQRPRPLLLSAPFLSFGGSRSGL